MKWKGYVEPLMKYKEKTDFFVKKIFSFVFTKRPKLKSEQKKSIQILFLYMTNPLGMLKMTIKIKNQWLCKIGNVFISYYFEKNA